jgi:hypothetical protein
MVAAIDGSGGVVRISHSCFELDFGHWGRGRLETRRVSLLSPPVVAAPTEKVVEPLAVAQDVERVVAA